MDDPFDFTSFGEDETSDHESCVNANQIQKANTNVVEQDQDVGNVVHIQTIIQTKKMVRTRKKQEKRKRDRALECLENGGDVSAHHTLKKTTASKTRDPRVLGGSISRKICKFQDLSDRDQTLWTQLDAYFSGTDLIESLIPLLPEGVPKQKKKKKKNKKKKKKKKKTSGKDEDDGVEFDANDIETDKQEEEEEEEEGLEEQRPLSMRTFSCVFTKYLEDVGAIQTVVNKGAVFDLYPMYKASMNLHRKRFDMFRRGKTILWPIYSEKSKNTSKVRFIETTLGQLNFFKFICEWGLLDYIKENHEEIKEYIRTADRKKRSDQIPGRGLMKKKQRKRKSKRRSFSAYVHHMPTFARCQNGSSSWSSSSCNGGGAEEVKTNGA